MSITLTSYRLLYSTRFTEIIRYFAYIEAREVTNASRPDRDKTHEGMFWNGKLTYAVQMKRALRRQGFGFSQPKMKKRPFSSLSHIFYYEIKDDFEVD